MLLLDNCSKLRLHFVAREMGVLQSMMKVRVYKAPMVLERIATVSTPITAHGCTLYTMSAVINAFAQVCLYLTLNDS